MLSAEPNSRFYLMNHEIKSWMLINWATQAPQPICVWGFFNFPKIFIYLFILRERERERERARACKHARGRERERQNPKQVPATLSVRSLMWGSIPWTVRLRPELKSKVGHPTEWATQVHLDSPLYSAHTSPIRYVVCEHFVPVYDLSFYSVNSTFQRIQVLNFDDNYCSSIISVVFSYGPWFWCGI